MNIRRQKQLINYYARRKDRCYNSTYEPEQEGTETYKIVRLELLHHSRIFCVNFHLHITEESIRKQYYWLTKEELLVFNCICSDFSF